MEEESNQNCQNKRKYSLQNTESEKGYIKENQILYFAQFDLFDENIEFYFMKYNTMKNRVKQELGEQWEIYSQTILQGGVFDKFLQLWLELKKEDKYQPQNMSVQMDCFQDKKECFNDESTSPNSNCIHNEVQDINVEVLKCFQNKFIEDCLQNQIEYDDSNLKAVALAFLNISEKTWKNIVESNQPQQLFGKQQQIQNDVTYINSILQPLVVAKEFILDLFLDQKLSKHFESKTSEYQPDDTKQQQQKTNIHNFLESCEDSLVKQFNQLNLKQNEFNIQKINNSNSNSIKMVKIQKIDKRLKKGLGLTNQFMNRLKSFIQNFIGDSNQSWQVALGFVTNIVNVNHKKFQDCQNMNLMKGDRNKADLRFYQPAQDFYHHLMKIYLILVLNRFNNRELDFNSYIQKVKQTMSDNWMDKYAKPSEFFFYMMKNEWTKVNFSDQQKNEIQIKIFIREVRSNLLLLWDQKFVQKFIQVRDKTIKSNSINIRQSF